MQLYCMSKPGYNDLVTSISISRYLFIIPVNNKNVPNRPEAPTILCIPEFECCPLLRDMDTRRWWRSLLSLNVVIIALLWHHNINTNVASQIKTYLSGYALSHNSNQHNSKDGHKYLLLKCLFHMNHADVVKSIIQKLVDTMTASWIPFSSIIIYINKWIWGAKLKKQRTT